MAIAFDAASTAVVSSGTSLTWSHTCTGSNLVLLAQAFSIGDFVSGITYNSVAMTLVNKTASGAGSNFTYLYALTNPATGAHSITVTYSSASGYTAGCAASYTGVKQTGQPEANHLDTSTTSSLAGAVTTLTDQAWVVIAGTRDSGVASGFTGGTARSNSVAGAFLADTNAAVSPAGSTTITVTSGGASNYGAVTVSLAPVAGTVTGRMLIVF